MKKDIFSRPARFVHKFGELETRSDPLEVNTFDFKPPVFPKRGSPALEVHQHGEAYYRKEPSPVQKPDGTLATLNGPAVDYAEAAARPIPTGTKRRKDYLKTDK